MKIFLRFLFTLILIVSVFLCSAYFFWYKLKFKPAKHNAYSNTIAKYPEEFERLRTKAFLLKEFAIHHSCSNEVCFLIDMSIASGKSRFFVYDLTKDSILLQGLVAHGSCNAGFQTESSFSNKENSGCSSLGKYKIGNSYYGKFGLAYKLYGLDSSNKNSFERNIVLHSYDCVPELETDPIPICNSRGCPMVSPGFLNQLKPIINQSERPILLWIFE
jgi:hypothetical protein